MGKVYTQFQPKTAQKPNGVQDRSCQQIVFAIVAKEMIEQKILWNNHLQISQQKTNVTKFKT